MEDTDDEFINLNVYDPSNQSTMTIKILREAPLYYLMDIYCSCSGYDKDTVSFVKDGRVINNDDTAILLDLEENDRIYFHKERVRNGPEYVKIKMVRTDNYMTLERNIKRQEPLKNLMAMYCECFSFSKCSTLFMFENRMIRDEDTAVSVGLKNYSIIKIYPKQKAEYVIINVMAENTTFKVNVKKSFNLKKLKNSCCKRLHLDEKLAFLVFNGKVIKDEDTPSLLEMKDGDIIKLNCHPNRTN